VPLENEIRREDIGYRLSKALEIKGQGTPILSLDNSVVPVVVVEDLSAGNEQDFAVNRWCRGRGSTPAGAAFGKLSFNNYVDSGILVKVYRVQIYTDEAAVPGASGVAGHIVGMAIETASAGGTQITSAKGFTDARLSHGQFGSLGRLPSVDIRYDNSGGIGIHMWRGFVPVTGVTIELGGWVLRPGTRLHFEDLAIGVEYNVSAEWTETNL